MAKTEQMKLEGRITILCGEKGVEIEICDSASTIKFLEINLPPEKFTAAIGRLAMVECNIDVKGLDKIGKRHEHKKFEFCIEGVEYNKEDKEKALWQTAQEQLTDGWVADRHFSSKDTFFTKDGERWARVTIRRWV